MKPSWASRKAGAVPASPKPQTYLVPPTKPVPRIMSSPPSLELVRLGSTRSTRASVYVNVESALGLLLEKSMSLRETSRATAPLVEALGERHSSAAFSGRLVAGTVVSPNLHAAGESPPRCKFAPYTKTGVPPWTGPRWRPTRETTGAA